MAAAVHGMDARTTIELERRTYSPQEVHGRHYGKPGAKYRENFPLYAIDGNVNPSNPPPPPGADIGWRSDPLGARREQTPITFTCEGEDAIVAMWKIQSIMASDLPPTRDLMLASTDAFAAQLEETIKIHWDGPA